MTTAFFHDFSALLANSCSSRSPRHWARASRVTIKIGVGKRSHDCGHFFAAYISGGLNLIVIGADHKVYHLFHRDFLVRPYCYL